MNYQERALAIIDRLTDSKAINIRERGTLRRAILLPERPQGEWEESHIYSCGKILKGRNDVIEHKCSVCKRWSIKWDGTIPDNFCSHCGADMRGDNNG